MFSSTKMAIACLLVAAVLTADCAKSGKKGAKVAKNTTVAPEARMANATTKAAKGKKGTKAAKADKEGRLSNATKVAKGKKAKADKEGRMSNATKVAKGKKAKADSSAEMRGTKAPKSSKKCKTGKAGKGKGKKGEADPACDDAQARTGNTVLLAVVLPAGATAAQIAALEDDVAATMLAALKASADTASASASDFSVEYDPEAKAFRVIFNDAALANISIENAAVAAEAADFSTLATDAGDTVAVGTIETTTTVSGSGSGVAAMMAGEATAAQGPKSHIAGMATFGVAAVFIAVGAAVRYRKRRGYTIVEVTEAPAKENTPLLA